MDNQDQRKTQAIGHENHGVHLCHQCGWPFPKPHPSAKHRRAHKRICGTIEGYKLVEADDDASHLHLSNDEHHSDEDRRQTPSPRGLESSNSQNPSGEDGERLISGDEVFADAVAEFSGGGWNSGSKENVRENLEPVTVEDDSTHIPNNENFGGSAVADENQLKMNSNDSYQMQDSETPETTETTETTSILVNLPDWGAEETGVQLLDNKPGSPSNIYAEKVEGRIDGLHEGVSVDAGNGVTESTCTLQADATDNFYRNIPFREDPIRVFEETSKLNVNDVASSDTEAARDFVSKEENSADGLLDLHRSAHSLDVGQLQHTSISTNNSQVNLGLHTLQEGESEVEVCVISVPDDMPILTNPTILIEDSEDPKKVKLQISSTLQSHETIKNDEYDVKHVASVERLIVLHSESSSMASEVTPGESYVANDHATQHHDSYELMVIEEPRKLQIVEPLIERKTNVVQSSDDNGASLVDLEPDVNGQTGSFPKGQDSDDFCKDLEVDSPDCPVSASNVFPTDVSVCSVDHDKNTIGDDKHKSFTESDRAVRINTLQSDNKEPLLQSKLPDNTVDGENNSNHEKLEAESHDIVEFHFREGSIESESNHHETYGTAGLICNDDTHHVEETKIDGVHIDGSDIPEVGTEKHDDETKTAILHPSQSLSQSLEKPLLNKAEGYGLDVCEAGEIENTSIAEDQSLAGASGKNTLPFESACSSEIVNESVKKSQRTLCTQSLVVSGSEETNKEDTDIMDIVSVECEIHAEPAFDLQTDNVMQDKEMEDPISKDNQTKGFRGEAGGLFSASIQDQGGNDLVKQKSSWSGIDGSVGICSRSDSLECNWGSVSVISLQFDAPAVLEPETVPSVDSLPSTEGTSNFKSDAAYDFQRSEKSEMFEPPSFMTLVEPGNVDQMNAAASEGQTGQEPQHPTSPPVQAGWFPSLPQVANDSEGRKKNEEIIAKVTNWSTGKQHAPLKSLLSEAAQDTHPKSSSTKDNLGLENQKTEKAAKDNCAKTTTVNSILGPESPATQVAKKEIAKGWNSPARCPSDIQREKRKVRGRPFWTQFVCCTSVNSQ